MIYTEGIFGLCVNKEVDYGSGEKMVSWSQYTKYRKCPKSWELKYIHKHKLPSDSIHLIYGTAMHEVIQTYLHTAYHETVKEANAMDLNTMLMNELSSEYKKAYEKSGIHFSSPEQLSEYYSYGIEIIEYLRKKRTRYFTTKNTKLIGIEMPIFTQPHEDFDKVKMQSFLDLVFYDKKWGEYLIVDIKTSTKGWNKWKRKDKLSTDQIVLYKHYFCNMFNINPKKVKVEYFILRNKVDPDAMYPIPRISEFEPSNGSISMKRIHKDFLDFIEECFVGDGEYNIDREYPALKGRNDFNCTFCEYKDRHDLCPPENRISNV